MTQSPYAAALGDRRGDLHPVLRILQHRGVVPRVTVTETAGDRQRFAMTIDLPLIGRVYEYAVSFSYEIREDA